MKNEVNGIKNELNTTSNTGEVNKKRARTLIENNGISEETLLEVMHSSTNIDFNDIKAYVDFKIREIEEKLINNAFQNMDKDKFISILKKEKVQPSEFLKGINRETNISWWVNNCPETLAFIRNNGGLVNNLTSTKSKAERVVVKPSDEQIAIVLSLQETTEVEIDKLIQEIDEFVRLFKKEEWNKIYYSIVEIIDIVKDGNMHNGVAFTRADRNGQEVLTWFIKNRKDILSFLSDIGIIKHHPNHYGEKYSLLLDTKTSLMLLNKLNEIMESELEK